MESDIKGRPTGPNKITKTMVVVFNSDNTGEQLYQEIDSNALVEPNYRRSILNDMKCFNTGLGYVAPNPLDYCDDCPFGISAGNTRTLCPQYSLRETESNLQYVVLPYQNNRVVKKKVGGIDMSIVAGVQELEKQGFVAIQRDQIIKAEKVGGLGFSVDIEERRELESRFKELVLESGIKIPTEYTINNLGITGDIPVIAKNQNAHRGNEKYFLENSIQKSKYLAGLYFFKNAKYIFKGNASRDAVLATLDGFIIDAFDSVNDMADLFDEIVIQKYISSPQDQATSVRVVSSGYGDIQYAELLVSPQKNEMRQLSVSSTELKKLEDADNPLRVFRSIVKSGNKYSFSEFEALFFTNPGSPLYLNTKDVVSNYAKGSVAVPLNGSKVNERWLVEHLDLMGIDPSYPQLPGMVLEVSRRIGSECKFIWPYVGIDFIPDESSDFYYLETNMPPQLTPEMVSGAAAGMNDIALQNLLIRNIAQYRKSINR